MSRRNFSVVLALAGLLGGCVTAPPPAPPPPIPPAAFESHEAFFAANPAVEQAVACPASAQRMLVDGRLEALISLSNRTDKPFAGEMACVFKDARGAAAEAAPAWQKLTLAPHATETLRFTSADAKAKAFTFVLK